MGIINLAVDSFSGDGLGDHPEKAVEQALEFEAQGADIIDVGAESTRPGHTPIPVAQEISILIRSLEKIVSSVKVPISVDTYKAEVAGQALEMGASMINNVWGPRIHQGMARVIAKYRVPIVLMHNQVTTQYVDLVPDVMHSLKNAAGRVMEAGVSSEDIVLDPGIGFGKTADHNLEILRRLREFQALGFPLMIGTSRKSTIGLVLRLPVDQRLEGTAATVALSIAGGADIVRIHDVKEMARVAKMSDTIVRDWRPQHWQR